MSRAFPHDAAMARAFGHPQGPEHSLGMGRLGLASAPTGCLGISSQPGRSLPSLEPCQRLGCGIALAPGQRASAVTATRNVPERIDSNGKGLRIRHFRVALFGSRLRHGRRCPYLGATLVSSSSMASSHSTCVMWPKSICRMCRLCPRCRCKSASRSAISSGPPAKTFPPEAASSSKDARPRPRTPELPCSAA